jgi:hypothetical protein
LKEVAVKRTSSAVVPLAFALALLSIGHHHAAAGQTSPVVYSITDVSPSFGAILGWQAQDVDPEKITVYVTRTGAKYHRDGCRYLSRSKIPMTLKEAAKRFEPCKVCRPPTINT